MTQLKYPNRSACVERDRQRLDLPPPIVYDSPRDFLGILYIVLSAIGFGTIGVFAKLAYAHGLNPLSTQIWKLGGGTLLLWMWILPQRMTDTHPSAIQPATKRFTKLRHLDKGAIAAFLLGAIGYAAYSISLFEAFSYATVGVTMLLFYTYPAFAALLRWLVHQQALNRWQSVCLGLTLVGCAITVDWQEQTSNAGGIMLGLGAAVCYACYLLGSARIVSTRSPLQSAAWMLSGATVTMVAIALCQTSITMPGDGMALGAIVGLAAVSTALPIGFLYAGLRRIDLLPTTILSTLEPVVAIAFSTVFLGESIWAGQIIGGLCILTSAILLQVRVP